MAPRLRNDSSKNSTNWILKRFLWVRLRECLQDGALFDTVFEQKVYALGTSVRHDNNEVTKAQRYNARRCH
jgi:hypothetical protein